jgi:electron transfer flavoprotein alpha subunit
MAVLVLIDHEAGQLKQPARSAVAAATKIGGDVHALVAGENVGAAAAAAAKLPGVTAVLKADSPALANLLAEPLAKLLVALAPDYTHLLAASTATGKNVMPRVAALLDVQPIADIAEVIDADTFVRPIYAGNALATVKSSDTKKVITVRAASFDPVATDGGSAAVQDAPAAEAVDGSRFVSAELSKSERPELTAARVVVSACRTARISTCWTRWPTSWARPWAPAAPRWMRVSCRTNTRWARPARSWRRTCTSPWVFPAPFSTWPA